VELRVQRDQEADEDFEDRMKLRRHKVVVNMQMTRMTGIRLEIFDIASL